MPETAPATGTRRLVPVAFEQQALGGLLLVAAGFGVFAVVQAERRGLAAAAVFLAGGSIYLGVVWRLQLRAALERALTGAAPAPRELSIEPRPLTFLRSLLVAAVVGAVAVGLGLLHLGGAGIVVLLGASAVSLLRAARVTAYERTHATRVHRARGVSGYLLRARTVESSLPVVAPPPPPEG